MPLTWIREDTPKRDAGKAAARRTHADRVAVTAWLENRGFQPSGGGLLKRRVRRA